jgi:Fe-S cluster assembly ATP-binding protein
MQAELLLNIENLKARVAEKEILKGLNLKINPGEVHAIMGPNGSGKSSLSKVIAGHPSYQVTEGVLELDVHFKRKNLLGLDPYERAREGVFLGFQYPVEISGVSNITFLLQSYNSIMEHQGVPALTEEEFLPFVRSKMKILNMPESYLYRGVNLGFSGGEKKRNEVLQLLVLNPKLALLDEVDSGLDIDALKIVAEGVNSFRDKTNGVILVTHYQRLLNYIRPDFVHVLVDGQIKETGGFDLVQRLETQGYDWILQ